VLALRERETPRTVRLRRRARKRKRRELRARDRRSARLAELHHIDALLADAGAVIDRGWIQHGWFAYDDVSGVRHTVAAYTVRTGNLESVAATCLVGAIVHAAGGPSTARSQLVQRTLDLTWHTLYRRDDEGIRWSSPPSERAGHVQDLARWNDRPGRQPQDVSALLDRARRRARAEQDQARGDVEFGAVDAP
jgi:hypothetical protein